MVSTDVTFGAIFFHAASLSFFLFAVCFKNIQLLIVYKTALPSSTWICLAKKILELFEQSLRNKHRCHLLFVCAMRSTLRSVFTQFLFCWRRETALEYYWTPTNIHWKGIYVSVFPRYWLFLGGMCKHINPCVHIALDLFISLGERSNEVDNPVVFILGVSHTDLETGLQSPVNVYPPTGWWVVARCCQVQSVAKRVLHQKPNRARFAH